jgi:hypothetical protein
MAAGPQRSSVVLALLACLIGAGCGAGTDRTDSPRAADFADRAANRPETPRQLPGLDALEERLGGKIGATLGAPGAGPVASGGELRSGAAWSTIKVPIVLRVLQDADGPAGLTPRQRDLARRAITLSDNDAAAELFAGLERSHGGLAGASAAVTEVLREAGDDMTTVSTHGRGPFSTYGQTEWSLRRQQRFMAALAGGCIASSASRRFVLDLMGQVTSDTWGLGSAGVEALWKGGWGPGVDGRYLVRQMGEIRAHGRPFVVTVAAIADDGTFGSGQELATTAARLLARLARTEATHRSPC